MINNCKDVEINLTKFGQIMGLSRSDIILMLKDTKSINEQNSLSIGPPDYCGAFYGTVSIIDFF